MDAELSAVPAHDEKGLILSELRSLAESFSAELPYRRPRPTRHWICEMGRFLSIPTNGKLFIKLDFDSLERVSDELFGVLHDCDLDGAHLTVTEMMGLAGFL